MVGGGQGRGVCGYGMGVGVVNNPKLSALGSLGLKFTVLDHYHIFELMHLHT